MTCFLSVKVKKMHLLYGDRRSIHIRGCDCASSYSRRSGHGFQGRRSIGVDTSLVLDHECGLDGTFDRRVQIDSNYRGRNGLARDRRFSAGDSGFQKDGFLFMNITILGYDVFALDHNFRTNRCCSAVRKKTVPAPDSGFTHTSPCLNRAGTVYQRSYMPPVASVGTKYEGRVAVKAERKQGAHAARDDGRCQQTKMRKQAPVGGQVFN